MVLVLKCSCHPSVFFFLFERRMGRTKPPFEGRFSVFLTKGINFETACTVPLIYVVRLVLDFAWVDNLNYDETQLSVGNDKSYHPYPSVSRTYRLICHDMGDFQEHNKR